MNHQRDYFQFCHFQRIDQGISSTVGSYQGSIWLLRNVADWSHSDIRIANLRKTTDTQTLSARHLRTLGCRRRLNKQSLGSKTYFIRFDLVSGSLGVRTNIMYVTKCNEMSRNVAKSNDALLPYAKRRFCESEGNGRYPNA